MKVEFSVSALYSVYPGSDAFNLRITTEMREEQIKTAIVALVGTTLGEQTMYEFMKAEFPDWFEPS